MKYILIIIMICSGNLFAGELKGIVLDTKNKSPLEYIDVILHGSNLETLTDSTGYFEFNNIPDGKYILEVKTMFYEEYEENITFNSSKQSYDLKIQLEKVVPYIPIDPEIEEYHAKLNSFAADEILKIHLDSLTLENGYLNAFSTFENQSDYPIYVIKTVDCLVMSYISIENEEIGKKPIGNMFYDCLGMKTIPDSSVFVEIPPHSKTQYSPVRVGANIFSNDNRTYQVFLTYDYKRKDKITGRLITGGAKLFKKTYNEAFYYYNIAFRGKVESSNSLTLEREKLFKD